MKTCSINRGREGVFLPIISYKLLHLTILKLIQSRLTTLLLLPALFSCCSLEDNEILTDGESETILTIKSNGSGHESGCLDIFTFNSTGAGHLDSYQHIESFNGSQVGIRSQKGEKHVFICMNGQRSRYDWADINSMESLNGICIELKNERRNALCATAEGTITAGNDDPYTMEFRRMASEITVNSIRTAFAGKSYEGQKISDVSIYLTNVNARCSLAADGAVIPSGIINAGGADHDEMAEFAEPDMLFQKMDEDIGEDPAYPEMSFICYPNGGLMESPGTPFTKLVIEGDIDGRRYRWPIDINRGEDAQYPGIHRNSRYILDITITGKESDAQATLEISPWKEKEEQQVLFQKTKVMLTLPQYETKASIPDEEDINDINLIAFADKAETDIIWKSISNSKEILEFDLFLPKDRRCTIAAIANLGRKLDLSEIENWQEMAARIKDADGFRHGIPMTALLEDITPQKDIPIQMELVRAASKISLRIDRARLSKDVRMTVKNVRIGNYPRSVSLWKSSKAGSAHELFETGFELTAEQCNPLNQAVQGGLSEEVSAYMLENMQGNTLNEETSSFIEIEMEYQSSELISYDSPLIYRFRLGEKPGNYDIERNCHYRFTVIPENDGLSGSGWKVDKSGIGPSGYLFRMHPGDYVEGKVGESLHIWCECYPKSAPFSPGLEELDYDKSRGIYDYQIDEDGHGVMLYLKKPGTGIVYMQAGEPINESGMVLVRVNP